MSGILLIHGGWHGPWYWEDFAARLADHGHDVRTVQLRGHDQAPGRIWHRVRHYVEDVGHAAGRFSEPPIVVGHSMGGLLVQKYLERHRAPGAVLMASIPPGGVWGIAARLTVRHPVAMAKVNLRLSLKPLLATPALARELLFTPWTPQQVVDGCHARLQDESYLAFVDMLAFTRSRPPLANTPILVLGAEQDAIISVREVHRTASAYGTRPQLFPDMGHNMMLEPGWARVADRVDAWVREIHA